MRLRVLLVGEGNADLPLVRLVQTLALGAGATRVEADARTFGHDPAERIAEALRFDPTAQLLVVHRDADRAGLEARRAETLAAAEAAGVRLPVVPCVPVRETEAWLLLDEAEIRRVAGNPLGKVALDLPPPSRAELLPDPKRVLRDALLVASEATGRRRRDAERSFDAWRRILLEGLDPEGPVAELPSFQAFRRTLEEAVHELLTRQAAGARR